MQAITLCIQNRKGTTLTIESSPATQNPIKADTASKTISKAMLAEMERDTSHGYNPRYETPMRYHNVYKQEGTTLAIESFPTAQNPTEGDCLSACPKQSLRLCGRGGKGTRVTTRIHAIRPGHRQGGAKDRLSRRC